MKLIMHEGKALVRMQDNRFLVIGTKKEVMFRPELELVRMYFHALAIGDYNDINVSPSVTH